MLSEAGGGGGGWWWWSTIDSPPLAKGCSHSKTEDAGTAPPDSKRGWPPGPESQIDPSTDRRCIDDSGAPSQPLGGGEGQPLERGAPKRP